MKKDQVPQDDEQLMEGRTREICYAVDDQGHYVRVLSPGWEPKNAALKQAWAQIGEEAAAAFARFRAGEVSPLAFYMARGMFDVALLSAYTDIPKRKIRDHLDPEAFRRLDEETLARYAEALGVPPDELKRGPETAASFPGAK